MRKFWVIARFLIFLPIALLLAVGFVLAGITNLIVFNREGRATIRRWYKCWWQWVTGEITTYELIK